MSLIGSPPDVASIRSSAAERMRRYRQRRRDGLHCLLIELRETEIFELVRMGLLKPKDCNRNDAILTALYAFLDETMGV
jgi:hypothetical protein